MSIRRSNIKRSKSRGGRKKQMRSSSQVVANDVSLGQVKDILKSHKLRLYTEPLGAPLTSPRSPNVTLNSTGIDKFIELSENIDIYIKNNPNSVETAKFIELLLKHYPPFEVMTGKTLTPENYNYIEQMVLDDYNEMGTDYEWKDINEEEGDPAFDYGDYNINPKHDAETLNNLISDLRKEFDVTPRTSREERMKQYSN